MFSLKKENNILKIKLFGLKIKISLSFGKIIIKNFKFLVTLFDYILPKDNNKIVFLLFPGQENKTDAFYNYIKNNHHEIKCIRLVEHIEKIKNKNDLLPFYSFKAFWHLYTSKYVVISVTGFVDYIKSKRHVGINLWHGMPIKTIGVNADFEKSAVKSLKYVGKYFKTFATSDIFRTIMASSFMAKYNDVYITGLPITDTIFSNDKNNIIENSLNIKKYDKIITYVPTFKSKAFSYGNQIEHTFNNIFYFDDYNNERFVQFLEEQNILFITKPHPLDEELYKENQCKLPNSSNFKLLYNDDFQKLNIDLYDLFKYTDLMISDFSSTTLDFLILNKPVIYLNNLSEEFAQNRGFILSDNYEIFMPGHQVNNYSTLEDKIKICLYNDDTIELRKRLLNLTHKYRDDKASERIFEIIKGL